MTSAPFQIKEFGWGEFSIGVKVYFKSEEVTAISFIHNLRLFAKTTLRKPVIAEKLDAFVFPTPSAELKAILEKEGETILPKTEITEHCLTNLHIILVSPNS